MSRLNSVDYIQDNGYLVGYNYPDVQSRVLPIGIVGIVPKVVGENRLLDGIVTVLDFVYSSPIKLFDDLRGDHDSLLRASNALNQAFVGLPLRINDSHTYIVYFVEKNRGKYYKIPLSLSLTQWEDASKSARESVVFLNGIPYVSVLKEKSVDKQFAETDKQKLRHRQTKDWFGFFGGPLGKVEIKVHTNGNDEGKIKPASGISLLDLESRL